MKIKLIIQGRVSFIKLYNYEGAITYGNFDNKRGLAGSLSQCSQLIMNR